MRVIALDFKRSTYIVVAALVVCCLLAAGFAQWFGFGAGGHSLFLALSLIAYCVGAVGVVWLGWFWMKTARTITSIAESLQPALPELDVQRVSSIEFRESIIKHIESYTSRIEQLRKQVKDLQIQIQLSQRQRKNTEAIIYSLHDAVIVVDEFDRLLMANQAAGALFHFDIKNSQLKPIGEVIAPDKKEFVDFLRHSRQSEVQATRHEIEFLQDEDSKFFDCVISCVYDSPPRPPVEGPERGQQVCGVAAVLHDVTREKQIQKTKSDFVSHVSHELKTPLASIMAYSEMLTEGETDDEETRKRFYSVIQDQAKRLNRLIDDILNISRIESGLIKIEKQPVSLTIMIEEQLQMIKGYAEEKGVEIIAQKPIIYDQVYADKDMISQVIVNLLSNAVKYTPRGGTVKIETAVDEIAAAAQVTVTDTGVGIPKEEIGHVFDKFYRVKVNQSQASGTGLGLNLVKQIVEKVHNGKVFVISEPGVGSTFGFELPLATHQTVEAI